MKTIRMKWLTKRCISVFPLLSITWSHFGMAIQWGWFNLLFETTIMNEKAIKRACNCILEGEAKDED